MQCLRPVLLFVGTVLLTVVSEAQFTQPLRGVARDLLPIPLTSTLLDAIDDANLIAELKLTDDQSQKLVARRQEVWDEQFTTGKDKFAEGTGSRADDTDKVFKKVLTAGQYKRAVQIATQRVVAAKAQVLVAVLRTHPEIMSALQLTDEQKQQVDNGVVRNSKGKGNAPQPIVAGSISLDTKQVAALKDFLGPPYSKGLQSKTDTRLHNPPTEPQALHLLASKDFKEELDLNADQIAKLMELREKWASLSRITQYSPKTLIELAKELSAECDKTLASTLTPQQRTRFKQIGFQSLYHNREIDLLYEDASIIAELALTQEQRTKIGKLWVVFREKSVKAFEVSETFASIEMNVNELSRDRKEKAAAVLSAEQSAKLRDLFGEPFIGRLTPDRTQDPGMPRRGLVSPDVEVQLVRKASLGKYATELNQLAQNKAIQKDLKLTQEQIKKAREALTEIQTKLVLPILVIRGGFNRSEIPAATAEEYVKKFDERSKAIESALEKILTADQAKRFREIMLQILKHTSEETRATRPMVIPYPIRYPGVAEAVKLTEGQRQKLITNDSLDEILTRDQKIAISKMLGEPFKGTPSEMRDLSIRITATRPRPEPSLRTPTPAIVLLSNTAKNFEEALKLTHEQSKSIGKALDEYHSALGMIGTTVRNRRTVEDALSKAVAAALTEAQVKRVAQLVVQIDAATNLFATLAAPDMVKKLELTGEEIDKLSGVEEDLKGVQQLISSEQLYEQQEKLMLRSREIADDGMLAVLTDNQKAKWKELTGEPWKDLPKGQGLTARPKSP